MSGASKEWEHRKRQRALFTNDISCQGLLEACKGRYEGGSEFEGPIGALLRLYLLAYTFGLGGGLYLKFGPHALDFGTSDVKIPPNNEKCVATQRPDSTYAS